MLYSDGVLVLEPTRIRDALGVIDLTDLPDVQPRHPARATNSTPLIERLWRIALSDVERNIVELPDGAYFDSGASFSHIVFTRDIAYSGVLGLNRLFPDIMLLSLRHTRKLRLELGYLLSRGHELQGFGIDYEVEDIPYPEFLKKYGTNCYTRRTDDVVWLWAGEDLLRYSGTGEQWRWLYEMGKHCFEKFYEPFYDPQDGLFKGQATFIDINFPDRKATGYPQDWSVADCIRVKPTSTNCLYYRGTQAMAQAAAEAGLREEADGWRRRAKELKNAIRSELRNEDGTFAYFKLPDGSLEPRREALGTALSVLFGVVEGEEAARALKDYPVTDAGVPILHPFYPHDGCYHNNSSWPFADAFFLMALEKADAVDRTGQICALVARTCRPDGRFHELVDFRDKSIRGSTSQLWTAAAFLGTCMRAGLV